MPITGQRDRFLPLYNSIVQTATLAAVVEAKAERQVLEAAWQSRLVEILVEVVAECDGLESTR